MKLERFNFWPRKKKNQSIYVEEKQTYWKSWDNWVIHQTMFTLRSMEMKSFLSFFLCKYLIMTIAIGLRFATVQAQAMPKLC